MLKAIVDTDILSEILAGVDRQVLMNASEYIARYHALTFTSVTTYEIITGLERIKAYAKLHRAKQIFNRNEEIVPVSEDYVLAGQILGTLRRTGKEVGYSDPLITACAIRGGFTVVTGNLKHFKFIVTAGFELDLVNWRSI